MFAVAGVALVGYGYACYNAGYLKGCMDTTGMNKFLQELWKETHRQLSYGKTNNISDINLFEL